MPAIFFQEPLPFDELAAISQEFTQYDILTEEADWERVEVLYGDRLTEEELKRAPRLRWIHCTTPETSTLCLKEIQNRGNISVTISKGQNVQQIGEFVIGAILAFAKQFFHWPQVPHEPAEFWDWPLKDTMWSLKERVLLQVGLGEVGSEVARLAEQLGMKTWGVRQRLSFNPYCKKNFSIDNIHSLLPVADVVVVALPKMMTKEKLFGFEEFNLMKPDSIFIVIGSGVHVNESALAQIAETGKFRGILLDAFEKSPPSKKHPLWQIPNAILTPSVADIPRTEDHLAFRLFRKNMRKFIPGRTNEMKNLIEL